MIPPLTHEGLLPPGRHPATFVELEQAFVVGAPNPVERARIYSGLQLYVALLRELLPNAALWINGGFTTHKSQVPADVDVAIAVPAAQVNALKPTEVIRFLQLLTLQHVTSASASSPRVQPMGGLIDAHLVDLSDPASMAVWDQTWSGVTDPVTKTLIPSKVKGYLEVQL